MTIRIDGLTFSAIIGLLDFERKEAQRVRVDCMIEYTGEYVDYAVVHDVIVHTIKEGAFTLLEDALGTLIPKIKNLFPQITAITLKIAKPDIFDDCSVSVEASEQF